MHRAGRGFATAGLVALLAVATGCGGGGGGSPPPEPPPPPAPPPPPPPTTTTTEPGTGPAACVDGVADGFDCHEVDLAAYVPLSDMGGSQGNDIWGWTDPLDGQEYALMGMNNGVAFVNVTSSDQPVVIGRLPTRSVSSGWRDIKVAQDHAYVVADSALDHGMQIFDLTRLRTADTDVVFGPDYVYREFGSAHNLAINEASTFAYAVGSDTCLGGLHMIDIADPTDPRFAGCHDEAYTHDAQCVIYGGPDTEHDGREICFNSNGAFSAAANHIAVVDVTDKDAPETLSTFVHVSPGYVHQAWLTEDHRYLLANDEFDETELGIRTRTLVFDVADLDAPVLRYAHSGTTTSIDHNHYVVGNRVFQANYTSGLRILDFTDLDTDTLTEVGYFDTYPQHDAPSFSGAWSVYPWLPSGTVIVSDIDRGLFVLRPTI